MFRLFSFAVLLSVIGGINGWQCTSSLFEPSNPIEKLAYHKTCPGVFDSNSKSFCCYKDGWFCCDSETFFTEWYVLVGIVLIVLFIGSICSCISCCLCCPLMCCRRGSGGFV